MTLAQIVCLVFAGISCLITGIGMANNNENFVIPGLMMLFIALIGAFV